MNLTWLRPLYERPGPWASAYLDASHNVENAAAELQARWQGLRERLTAQGADASTVAALDDTVLAHDTIAGRYGLALFATHGEAVLVERLPDPPRADLAAWGPLPHAMPLVAQRGEQVAWLRVIADRIGADLKGVTAGGVPRTGRVSGDETFPIRKTKPGGWSQPRYHRAAEEMWHRNAGDVAAAAAQLADEIGAEVLVVGGDVRTVQHLMDQLPARWRDRVVRTDVGSRAAGADNESLDDVTTQAVAEVAQWHTRDVLDRFLSQYANDASAGTGLAAVVVALQRGQADTVLMVDDPSVDQALWIGPEPTQLSLDAHELRAMGVPQPQRARADAALLRAMAMTETRLVLVGRDEAPLTGGIGAVLRYADASTRHR